tara:strand:+ start:301 stop:696 length:396 start_codon:yes stop_codon:yes gene_type:complete
MNNDKNTVMASTCLLLSIADSDLEIASSELKIIEDIISDFFQLNKTKTKFILSESRELYLKSTDLFNYSQILNDNFTYQDKLDFICCIYEVAFIDQEFHYMEAHTIKNIADMLNVSRNDLIKLKSKMKKFL